MSDNVIVALIGAAVSLLNSFMIWKAKGVIKTLEKNTNSIKDALVKTTGDAEFAKGLKQGKEEGGAS